MAVSATINGGTLYKPYIVKSINEPETNAVILKNNPQVVRKVISKETSDKGIKLDIFIKTGESINTLSDNLGKKFHLLDSYTTSSCS